jgi:hypothetical protein
MEIKRWDGYHNYFGFYSQRKIMKIDYNDMVFHEFTGNIECKFPSILANYLRNLYNSGDTAVGVLTELGYSGAFVVTEADLIHRITELTMQFQIRSIAKVDYNDKKAKLEFEDVYKGYVIREKGGVGYFVGPDTDRYRVILRKDAARFTKDKAFDYIQNGSFCKHGEFEIEDAV